MSTRGLPVFAMLVLLAACLAGRPAGAEEFVSAPEAPTGRPWLGFGYNQDPQDRDAEGRDRPWTAEHWALTTRRMAAIRPGFVRVVAYREWFQADEQGKELPAGTYRWDGRRMQSFIRVLQWYQEHKVPVMTGLWHAGFRGTDPPNYYTSPEFARLQADLFRHLYRTKRLTNIRWYTPTNEPAGCGITPAQWSAMMANTHAAFAAAGLPTTVLVGADSWDAWTAWAAEHNRAHLGGYDHHKYLNDGQEWLEKGELERYLAGQVASVLTHDAGKPVFLSEAGAATPSDIDYWFNIKPRPAVAPPDYKFGLASLDYGIQAARAGESGALAWSLDGYDYGKDPGMWNLSGANGGLRLRPWFYTWSLLCRCFPAGAEILRMSQPAGVRIVAAKIAVGKKAHWSFALVNRTAGDRSITLRVPGWGAGAFDAYVYSPQAPLDGERLSLPAAPMRTAGLSAGLAVVVPADGGVVLTSMGHAPLAPK